MGPEQRLTDVERASLDDVLAVAAEWAAGRMDWQAAARFGCVPRNGHPSPSYTRFLAVRVTPPGDPRRQALIRLCQLLDEKQGGAYTKHGRFTHGELERIGRETAYLLDRGIAWKGVR